MASTFPRARALLAIMLSTLLTNPDFGNELPITTYRDGADEADAGQLWRCRRCGRVELITLLDAPQCPGPPEKPHTLSETDLVSEGEDVPTDDRPVFE